MARLRNPFPLLALLILTALGNPALVSAEELERVPPKQKTDPSAPLSVNPAPSHANVPYGPGERNVMDVYLAKSDQPTPCVLHIHGGGWLQGDKTRFLLPGAPEAFLKAGISVVSINYRYLTQTLVDSGSTRGTGPILPRGDYAHPPVKVPLFDAARALQFIRSRAKEWNLDPQRIGVTGGSAGGATALWLAFHDDLADPDAEDLVARESTKPWCAATLDAQTTLDPVQILDWTPNATYGGHAFGYIWDKSDLTVEIRSFLQDRKSAEPWIQEYSPYSLASPDDPPVYLYYTQKSPPERGVEQKDPTHTANYGALLAEKLEKLGLQYAFVQSGMVGPPFKNTSDYLIHSLKEPRGSISR